MGSDQVESIPHLFHQIWIQGAESLPPRYRRFAGTWTRVNRSWERRLWDGPSIRRLLEARWPELVDIYDNAPDPRAQADIGRYAVLDAHGGVYADLDTCCVRPADCFTARRGATLIVQEYPPPLFASAADEPFKWVVNSILAAVPGHPIWRPVMAEIARYPWLGFYWWDVTGPLMLRRQAAAYAERQPEDVAIVGPPQVVTDYWRRERMMHLRARLDWRVRVLDFNDSARLLRWKKLSGIP